MYKRKQSRIMYLCAFGLPVLISILICICRGVYPFGRNCILHIDMYHQYEPFFTEFLDKLRNGSSLMYSYRLGLGSDFISLFAYYLASPLNWLVVLCPSSFTKRSSPSTASGASAKFSSHIIFQLYAAI